MKQWPLTFKNPADSSKPLQFTEAVNNYFKSDNPIQGAERTQLGEKLQKDVISGDYYQFCRGKVDGEMGVR